MEFRTFAVEGLLEITPRKLEDERGYFSEVFRLSAFAERVGPTAFVQDNQSLSKRAGTIRGLHFQSHPAAQGKLVRCLAGRLLDVAVDLRRNSPSYGQHVALELSPDDNKHFWIPAGFAHGFCTLEPDSVISYRVTSYYSPEHDKGVAWDDPDIAIDWPAIADPESLSAKDRVQPTLKQLPAYFSLND
ncbi:dTDP-4-dehydrorhamnose 3,5-epimerase [Sphingomonas piscis]|uniref:dTDP-4-dehydrorhamnose 3,5-epimerase n=1 Tax=Sphingomonas piscis TaxID=2714943 RepID=A0A6G7YMU6_9SPHN|nr:dTDP-4-dehydrorhamnose 3,5-epimerase [Sphingomonas piscis]QIK78061.1 dTDP-4-dehydrorhamnose 3,5-epimerase [Sphingomonas piscis]